MLDAPEAAADQAIVACGDDALGGKGILSSRISFSKKTDLEKLRAAVSMALCARGNWRSLERMLLSYPRDWVLIENSHSFNNFVTFHE